PPTVAPATPQFNQCAQLLLELQAAGKSSKMSRVPQPPASRGLPLARSRMPIRFRCAYCNQLMGIARRKAGNVVRCPRCAGQVIVPNADGSDPGTGKAVQPGGR